jgi:KDO2-lipid IV(A) lauroyltransferase
MNHRKTLHWLLLRCLEGVFFIYLGFLRLLPPGSSRWLSTPLLKILIFILIPKRRIVKNIGAAFGETYSTASKNGLAKGVRDHLARNLGDCFFQLVDPEHAYRSVTIEGLENLDATLSRRNGVIGLGAHIGNFVLVGTRLGTEGYPVSTLFRLPEDERLKGIIERHLPSFHQRIISSRPRRSAVGQILAALKQNQIVFILGDNLKRGKVPTVLFGQRVLSPRGPVSLALRSGAAVVPMYLVRNYQGGLCLVIEPEIPLVESGTRNENITYNTRQIVRHLEILIRRYPDQWNWLTVRMKRVRANVGYMRTGENYDTFHTREAQNEPIRNADQRIGAQSRLS